MNRLTEERNPLTMQIDVSSTDEILRLINLQDQKVPLMVGRPEILTVISLMIDEIVHRFQNGGRLFYCGAGTSGRLGILDAAECVPTFGTDSEMVQGLIAGGTEALTNAVEGAEDSKELGQQDLAARGLNEQDFVLGIAASGTTPYVIGALQYARKVGAGSGALSCNHNALISEYADHAIEVPVGPEVVTGSTRMKAGTAEKLVLNMISTTAMIKMGKVYENLMVDVKPTNKKLVERAKRIIREATGVSPETAASFYEKSYHKPKVAIIMILTGKSETAARELLNQAGDQIANAVKMNEGK